MRPIMSERELDVGWDLARSAGPAMAGVAMEGFRDRASTGCDMRIFARPAVTVVIQFGDSPLTVEDPGGQSAVDGLVAGLYPGIRRVHAPRVECVEVRISPIAAYRLLGVAPTDLAATLIGPADIWGSAAPLLREQLAETATWAERFAVTAKLLADRESTRTADPEVAACWHRIVADKGDVRVRELAELTGWSRRRLWSRFTAQVGVTPKRAAMVVRFRHAFDLLTTGRSPANVAVACGYSDQSHLHREVSAFAGITPGALSAP
ncbi:helix-turn-helix domain-containing protein [Nocardia sp. NPDC058519]|uniref:helix-turn-helix domain-containing protein n=1 Tax=Nocardia sp. NPDC058519 TaxID=3346535 RepID=UPI00365C5B35